MIDKNNNSVYPCTAYLTNGPWIYMVPQFKPENVLMLGYAGGTTAGLIKLIWGDIPITGVDINKCESTYGVNFIQADAIDFVKTCQKYDVVIVDISDDKSGLLPDFIFGEEFVSDLSKIANYIILNAKNDSPIGEYKKLLGRFGSNKPNRTANVIYYFGTKDYNHLIIKSKIIIDTNVNDSIIEYVNKYNNVTKRQGVSSAGADNFILDKEILKKCGYLPSKTILDYGCGWGSFLTIFPDVKDYIGVDISPIMVEEAKKRFPGHSFIINKIGELNLQRDIVVAHSVFTHIPKNIVNIALLDIKNSFNDFALIDIFYNERMGLFENYTHRGWIETLLSVGLRGEYLDKRFRSEDLIHFYYKIEKI